MTRRSVEAAFAALAIAVVVILVLWVYPGYATDRAGCPEHLAANGRVYCAETIAVQRTPPGPGGPPMGCGIGVQFQGVTFALVFFEGVDLDQVQGWVSSPTMSCQSVALTLNPAGPSALNWTSSDASVYILWPAPFTGTVDGTVVANVTCGVYPGA